MWAAGIILFTLLTGAYPFDKNEGESDNDWIMRIQNDGEAEMVKVLNKPMCKHISMEAKNLINNLVQMNPELRKSASKALGHQWFKRTASE